MAQLSKGISLRRRLRTHRTGSGATTRPGKRLPRERAAGSRVLAQEQQVTGNGICAGLLLSNQLCREARQPGAEGAETAESSGAAFLVQGVRGGSGQERFRSHQVPPARPHSHEQPSGERAAPRQARPAAKLASYFKTDGSPVLPGSPVVTPRGTASFTPLMPWDTKRFL